MKSVEIYSNLSRTEALDDAAIINPALRDIHHRMLPYLTVLAVQHMNYEGTIGQGQLVVHEAMRTTFKTIFDRMLDMQYPIQHVRPMAVYGWSDSRAMADNTTSVYRPDFIGDTVKRLASEHTRGSALDLNPLDNPLVNSDNTIEPKEAIGREPRSDAILLSNTAIIHEFDAHDMEYGGYWPIAELHDYYGPILMDRHHFELRPQQVHRLPVPAGIWQ